jgi:hypothetical protein
MCPHVVVLPAATGSWRQDHPVHIQRGGEISPDPSFTSWRSPAGRSMRAARGGRGGTSRSAVVRCLGRTLNCTAIVASAQAEVARVSELFAWAAASRWRRGNRKDAYLMAIMRAVVTAAPSSSVQATAWTSGIRWSSGLAGGSVPVTRLQPTRATFWAASTASSPAACFSARLARSLPSSAIGIPRPAAKHRGHRRRLCAQSSHSTPLTGRNASDAILRFHTLSAEDVAAVPGGVNQARKLAPPPPRQYGNKYQVRQAWCLSPR